MANEDDRIENAAILLMSLGEEEAAQVFKHLGPKEVQKLGETIAKMKVIPRERVESVLDQFTHEAAEQHMLVPDNDEYVKSVLRKALGDDKANMLIDRIIQGSDVSGIVGQRLQFGELQHLPTLAADARLQQFVTPLVLAAGFAGAGNARVGLGRAAGFVQCLDAGERHRLDGERPGDAQLVLGDRRLVVEDFLVGVGGDRGIHLRLHRLTGGVEGGEGGL